MREVSTRTSLLLVLGVSALRVCLAGQTNEFPKFVVPDIPDVTIKTRWTIDHPNSTVRTEILFLKRAWQRREQVLQFPTRISATAVRPPITITRCDERRTVQLNPEARTFASFAIEDPAEHVRRLRRAAKGRSSIEQPTGANVTITVDSVDTGERRQVGRFLARHVIQTTTTEAEPGANARSGRLIRDGWYIDLPAVDCRDWEDHPPMLMGSVVRAGSLPDREHLRDRRKARLGFPIEETSRTPDDAHYPTERGTLIEFSEAPLDESLFTVPAGYRPALPLLRGGVDMTRPDTLINRLESYWEEVTSWAQRVFRF